VAVAGVPMMAGSAVMEGFVPSIDATIVTRMLDEGCVIAGKSACEDLSLSGGAVTCNPRPPKNPVNPAMSAGGSSGGSAALLAAGEVDFAIGTDQGGSTRIPAALCGVVGLKATYGLVPATGIFPLENSIDHVCPMARTSRELALLLSVIAGNDELDPRMRHCPPAKDYTRALTGHAEGLKIAIVREGFGWAPEAEHSDAFVRERARRFERAGAKVVEISLPVHRDAGIVYTPLLMDGIARQLFRGNGFGMGWRGYYPTDWIDHYAKARKTKANSYSHLCKFVLLLGEYMNDEYNGRFYARAQNIMRACRQRYDEALAEFDLLLMPTCAPLAQALPQKPSYTAEEYVPACFSHHLNTGQFNGTGHPSISLNAGTLDGLPVGMMLTGKWFDEDTVLRAADAYEKLSG
jgi:amidase